MRIGIFGGSFDPVHYGHLLLAELCRESCQLDEVRLVPASIPPHKQAQGRAADDHRLAMLQLAVGGHPSINVSDCEIKRGGVSYTVETLRSLGEQEPNDELFFLMGADSLSDLPNWREPEAICRLAIIAVVDRPGSQPVDFSVLSGVATPERLATFHEHEVAMPQVELSSSEIRQRVALGKSIRYQTPRAVEEYIRAQSLYRGGS